MGSVMWNVVPWPSWLSTVMVPPSDSMMLRHTASPSPVPSPTGLVVKNGSKMRSRFSGGNRRSPVSLTSTVTRSGALIRARHADLVALRVARRGMACAPLTMQVEEHLPQPRRVGAHERHPGALLHQPRPALELVVGHLRHVPQHLGHIHRPGALVIRPRQRLEILRDEVHALGALARLLQRLAAVPAAPASESSRAWLSSPWT